MFPHMTNDRTHWESAETSLLLAKAIEEKQKYNWNQFGLTREGWKNIFPYFPQYTHKQVTNKFNTLKLKYRDWMDVQKRSGLGRDKATGGISADPEYWPTQYALPNDADDYTHPAETSNAPADRAHPPAFLSEMHALWGDRVTNSGTYISAGGIGSETPPRVSWQQDHSSPASYHSGSKRARNDQEVESPQKRRYEVGEYLGKISDSIAARSSSRERARSSEHEEVDDAMELLRADGVAIPSDLYFIALKSFESSVARREFLKMDGPEVRIAWLTWLVQQNQK